MRDALGNKLSAGQSVFLVSKQLVAKVVRVSDGPSVSVIRRNGDAAPQLPPTITLELTIPVMVDPRKRGETQCGDLLTVLLPTETERAQAIVDANSPVEEVQ